MNACRCWRTCTVELMLQLLLPSNSEGAIPFGMRELQQYRIKLRDQHRSMAY
ncbi:unnamed protein product, partial [Musa acuminata subsp. burmannicoides]